MRWYINDASLQGQFRDVPHFIELLDDLLRCRGRYSALNTGMYLTRSIAESKVADGSSLRQILSSSSRTDLRRAILIWLDRRGPFVEDDRFPEIDDYFECKGKDITDTGLGEAARRIKSSFLAQAFSFPGGTIDFNEPVLSIEHGLQENRFATYSIANSCNIDDLVASVEAAKPGPKNWKDLVVAARESFANLRIPDSVYTNHFLAREPFEAALGDRIIVLLRCLNDYMAGRDEAGAEGPGAREIVENHFTGDRALFSGESQTNQTAFRKELTFKDPDDPDKGIFAHWHGKISHRFFRLHFEWPVPAGAKILKVLYFGPKLTKG
jgi:hypothetical protein